jgi:hypothetical protein
VCTVGYWASKRVGVHSQRNGEHARVGHPHVLVVEHNRLSHEPNIVWCNTKSLVPGEGQLSVV